MWGSWEGVLHNPSWEPFIRWIMLVPSFTHAIRETSEVLSWEPHKWTVGSQGFSRPA